MAPSESAILRTYLLLPARLPAFLSLEQFGSYFPRSQQSSPQIRSLYRHLQAQRDAVVDGAAENIENEVKLGRLLRRHLIQAHQEAELEEVDDEIEIERNLFGPTSTSLQPKKHTLLTILAEMESATNDMGREIQELQAEEASLLNFVQQTVGSMSDLRYGRLANPNLKDEVLAGVQKVHDICKQKT